ncbi:MAG: IclR family transcriptional regulator [Burkholderiales bacterium]|nr:IclR family transcriptional regulator [Burkholderiales bacterium]
MSSLKRLLAVLDLFTEAAPQWTPEEIAERLGLSRPTGYRYVRELVAAGLLFRASASRYTLGPRIIELDYQIRRVDPVSRAGQAAMSDLAERTGCSVTLAAIYGDRILTLHLEQGAEALDISYGRGRPLPLFRGTPSRTLLAFLPRGRQRQLFERHREEAAAIGRDWEAFQAELQAIRRAGYGVSVGELDPHNAGIAVPVLDDDGQVLGSLCLVLPRQRLEFVNVERLVSLAREAAARMTHLIRHDAADARAASEAPARAQPSARSRAAHRAPRGGIARQRPR